MLIIIIPRNKPNKGRKDVYDKNCETAMKERYILKHVQTSHVHGQEEQTNASINSAGKAVSVHTES